MTPTITSITGKMILDSRRNPTLSITVEGSDGSSGTFSVPSGASTGAHEAHELRDNNTPQGGVVRALSLLEEEIAPALIGNSLYAQNENDKAMITLDATPDKGRLGANTLIGVSVAIAKAAAASKGVEVWQYLHDTFFADRKAGFPRLYANLINGGKHAQTQLAFQEYHIVPKTTNMGEASSLIARIQERMSEDIIRQYGPVKRGDEGGFALPVSDVEKPLGLLRNAVFELGLQEQVDFALDVAASSFFDAGKREYVANGTSYNAQGLTDLYKYLSEKYNLLSIEDPFGEEDFASFASLPQFVGDTLRVGDDLTTTNKERLSHAIREKSIDAIIIKPNQIGTLTETVETMELAHANGLKCIVSHRSGETLDSFIADLAYASGAFGIKLGAHGPSEREAKYARLMAIEKAN